MQKVYRRQSRPQHLAERLPGCDDQAVQRSFIRNDAEKPRDFRQRKSESCLEIIRKRFALILTLILVLSWLMCVAKWYTQPTSVEILHWPSARELVKVEANCGSDVMGVVTRRLAFDFGARNRRTDRSSRAAFPVISGDRINAAYHVPQHVPHCLSGNHTVSKRCRTNFGS
jgi:hypothetical protein